MAAPILAIWLGGMAVALAVAVALRAPTTEALSIQLCGVAVVAWPLMLVGGLAGLLVEGLVRARWLIAHLPAATCP